MVENNKIKALEQHGRKVYEQINFKLETILVALKTLAVLAYML